MQVILAIPIFSYYRVWICKVRCPLEMTNDPSMTRRITKDIGFVGH